MLVHVFYFKVVKLWEIPAEDIKKTGLTGILPLMVLARGGKKLAVVEEVITTLQTVDGEMAHELLSLTYIMAALVFKKEIDQAWLKRRFGMIDEVLKESWAYQEILSEGRQQERQYGLRRQRALLEDYVQKRFPTLVETAKQRGKSIDNPDILQDLMSKLFSAQDEVEAKDILRD